MTLAEQYALDDERSMKGMRWFTEVDHSEAHSWVEYYLDGAPVEIVGIGVRRGAKFTSVFRFRGLDGNTVEVWWAEDPDRPGKRHLPGVTQEIYPHMPGRA